MKNSALFIHDAVTQEEVLLSLIGEEACIGRSSEADVNLPDHRCSGIHVYLREVPNSDEYLLVDLGSHSGTFVDGIRIDETKLRSDQFFTIGNSQIRIKKLPKGIAALAEMDSKAEETNKEPVERVPSVSLVTQKNLLQVSLYWGQKLLEVRTFEAKSEITIGSARGATFGVSLGERLYRLARYDVGQVTLKPPIQATGLIWHGSETHTLEALRKKSENGFVQLRIGDRADIQIGELDLSFSFVEPAEKIPRFSRIKIDKRLFLILSAVAIFYFLLLSWLTLSPAPKLNTEKKIPERVKRVMFDAGIRSAQKKRPSAIGEIVPGGQGGRARGEEGASKSRKSPSQELAEKQPPLPKENLNPTQSNTEAAKAVPEKIEMESAFRSQTKWKKDSPTLPGQEESGNTLSALAKGGFARGRVGLGSGGGGQSVGIGQLRGLSTGGGMGAGDIGLAPSKGREIEIPQEEVIEIQGGIDPEVIGNVIRRYLPQIQHCYEAQLAKNPGLRGKIVVGFQIIADGSVKNPRVVEASLKHRPTQDCILARVEKWNFPKPKGGGTVGVKYPFLLMSAQ